MKAAPQDVRGSRGDVAEAPAGVAFVCHPYHRGGVTRWMIDAAAEFRRRGGPVWFVAPEPRKPFPSGGRRPTMLSLLRSLPASVQPTIISPAVGVEFELGTVAYRASVYDRAIRLGVPPGTPCIASDDPSVWKGVAQAADAYPMVGVLHGDDAAYYSLAREHRDSLARCVAVSRRIATRAQASGGPSGIAVIPCGIPLRPLRPVKGGAPLRLIWIGRMEEEFKRVSDLPLIAAALRGRKVPFVLDVLGDGEAERALRAAIDRLGLREVVRLRGWMTGDEIWASLCESDVLLLPSNREGMPIVMMEALAAGCAVVASRVSGVEDVELDERTSEAVFVHEVGDVEASASLVARILSMPSDERRKACRQVAEDLFSISACVDAYARELGTVDRDGTVGRAWRSSSVLEGMLSLPIAAVRATRRALIRPEAR